MFKIINTTSGILALVKACQQTENNKEIIPTFLIAFDTLYLIMARFKSKKVSGVIQYLSKH